MDELTGVEDEVVFSILGDVVEFDETRLVDSVEDFEGCINATAPIPTITTMITTTATKTVEIALRWTDNLLFTIF